MSICATTGRWRFSPALASAQRPLHAFNGGIQFGKRSFAITFLHKKTLIPGRCSPCVFNGGIICFVMTANEGSPAFRLILQVFGDFGWQGSHNAIMNGLGFCPFFS